MAVKRVKVKEGEKLTPENISKVVALIEAEKPITKKEACEILNITYNTTRLTNIILEYKHELELTKKRRAANRGKPLTDLDICTIVEDYLYGDSVKDISDRMYRSVSTIKNIIDKVGVPARVTGEDYYNFSPLPDNCISSSFYEGQLVWSARYQAIATVDKFRGLCKDGLSNVYSIYIHEQAVEPEQKFFASWGKPGFYANQPAYELGSLEHLKEYGVKVRIK